jgi:putative (di)nucleoside polyphosphate hydrolase
VGTVVFNREGRVFIGRRRRKDESDPVMVAHEWQMPQGGIDEGETPLEAALRELYEETNIKSVSLLAESPRWRKYDLPPGATRWKGKFKGQTQKWFALRFIGQDDEIDIERPAGGAHAPEFEDWRWERLEALPRLIVPFKRPVYEQIVRDFAHLSQSTE